MFGFKYSQQNDETDCGPACIASIFKKYGLKVSIATIRDIAGTDRQGTSIYGLTKVFDYYGYQHKVVETTKNSLNLKLPLPAIAHVIINDTLLHYVVVTKIKKDTVVVFDPAVGMVNYSKEDFDKIWTRIMIFVLPGKESPKGNKRVNTLSSFFRLLASQKWLLLKIFFLSLSVTLIGIITSFYYQVVMDSIVPSNSIKALNYVSGITLCLFLIQIVLSFLRGVLVSKLEQKIDVPIMLGYYNHVITLPLNFYSMRDTGELISRFNDASHIRNVVSQAALTIMMDTIMSVTGAVFLFNSNKVLFGLSALMLLLYGTIVFVYNMPMKKINRQTMELNSKVTSKFVETVNGIEIIKAFNQEINEINKTESLYKRFLKKVYNSNILYISQNTATTMVEVIGELAILWVGTKSVIEGNLTLGELITFNALLIYFVTPIRNLLNLQANIQNAVVAADRLGEILDIAPEHVKNIGEKIDIQEITISKLNFRYGIRDLVLKNINLAITQGEKIAFVGESGSGKSTLAKLLVKFYEQESGEIKINSVDIRDIPVESIRRSVSYISQNVFLFSGTIKENLMFGNPSATDEEIERVCRLCDLSGYINGLPLSYNTLIEENGKNLSEGQKQRIAIARTLLTEPDVLIMDEATSNLDAITERSISDTVRRISNNMTTIIIAHRLSTAIDCDKIFVFRNGEIIESGKHKQLLSKKGYYFELWNNYTQNM